MPTSNRANKKKPCIAAKTTDTSSCQTFHYASHSGVVSFVSPLVQQHCPFCQSSCLGHHPQDVPGKAGSSHARSTSSRARQSPLCPFSSMGPTLNVQSSSSKWDFFCRWYYNAFFLLLWQKNSLCPGQLIVRVTQKSSPGLGAWPSSTVHNAYGQATLHRAQTSAQNTYLSDGERINVSGLLWCRLCTLCLVFRFLEADF